MSRVARSAQPVALRQSVGRQMGVVRPYAAWMAVGIAFGAWKTNGFRGDLVNFELPPEEE